ncbi:MAG: T9SS type A sorting domain-containing protein [Saprospiraceae bacterium]|nr:T9SS type A sorting domain-containing protein [Saprospiraceae bacterium]
MIKKLTIFFILLLPVCINSQSIIEKFRSEGKARNPLKQLIRNTDDSQNAITDFNENGTEDFVSFKGTDEELQVVAYDGGSYEEIFNLNLPTVFQSFPGDQLSRIPLLYPMGSGLDYLIITMENVQEGDRTLIINPKDEVDFLFIPGRTILIADMDGDNWIDVLSWDFNDQSLVVYGIEDGNGVRPETTYSTTRGTGEVSLIYESEPDLNLNIEDVVVRSVATQDINDDGAVDVTVVRRNDDDDVTGIRVIDVFSGNVLFQQSLEELDDEVNRLHGYYDIDDDGVKEVLVGEDNVINQQGEISQIGNNFSIKAVIDVNGDGVADIIGLNTVNNAIQIWGLSNSTSVDEIESKLQSLSNFPNPFNSTTTIEYQLDEAGAVSVELRDAAGSLKSQTYLGSKPVGIHREEINMHAFQGGVYYYSIIVDGIVSTQKMIKL